MGTVFIKEPLWAVPVKSAQLCSMWNMLLTFLDENSIDHFTLYTTRSSS